jgi:chorismate-pyruvate lyase
MLPRPAVTPLTRFQHLLLDTDGTVTKILEAFAGEPMEVVKLLQVFGTAGDADADLLPVPGDQVLRRRVVLRGRHSHQRFLYAEAVVVLDRVAPAIVEGLLRTDQPIGILLAEARAETFREILRTGREPAGARGAHFGIEHTEDLLSRTYRIIQDGRPAILITEKFPAGFFRALPP